MNVIIHEHLTCYLLRWIIQMTVLICIRIFLDNFVGRPCDLSGYIVGYVCRNPLLVGRGYPQTFTQCSHSLSSQKAPLICSKVVSPVKVLWTVPCEVTTALSIQWLEMF